MRRKATQIAPAYNKGALQYLPAGKTRLSGLHARKDRRAASNIILASEVCGKADARLSSVRELQASGFEHLPETIYRSLAEFLPALKADNGFGGYLRSGGQFPGTQANSRSCHSALDGQHWSPLLSVPSAAVPQRDGRGNESAGADHVEDQ